MLLARCYVNWLKKPAVNYLAHYYDGSGLVVYTGHTEDGLRPLWNYLSVSRRLVNKKQSGELLRSDISSSTFEKLVCLCRCKFLQLSELQCCI